MRSRVVASVLVLLLSLSVLTLTGCGGSDSEESSAQTTGKVASNSTGASAPQAAPAAAPAAPGAPGAVDPAAAAVDRSPAEPTDYEPFPTDAKVTPKPVLQILKAQQPMIVYFYDSRQSTTDDLDEGVDGKGGIDKLMTEYRGMIDLVSFDIGEYVEDNSDGTIQAKPALAKDSSAQQAAMLASELDIKFTPYVLIVDRNGYITARFRGWDDYENLEREVLRATN